MLSETEIEQITNILKVRDEIILQRISNAFAEHNKLVCAMVQAIVLTERESAPWVNS